MFVFGWSNILDNRYAYMFMYTYVFSFKHIFLTCPPSRISQQKPKHNEKQLLNLMWWYDRELTNTHVLFQYYLHSMGRNCRSSSAMVLFLSFLLRYDSVICYLLNNDKAIMDDRERKKSKEKKRRKNCSTMTIRYLYAIW